MCKVLSVRDTLERSIAIRVSAFLFFRSVSMSQSCFWEKKSTVW